nr:LAG1 longevity assurance homolog 3-like [Tanacetum cinerariifolium]
MSCFAVKPDSSSFTNVNVTLKSYGLSCKSFSIHLLCSSIFEGSLFDQSAVIDEYLVVHNHKMTNKDISCETSNDFVERDNGIGNRLIFGKDQQKLDIGTEERNKKIQKFKESAWKCVYYLSAEIFALAITYHEPWLTNTNNFWVGPGTQRWPDQKAKLKLKGLYMYTAGFYMYSIFALIFWETRRSDFGVSMGHHVATLVLITTSYVTRFVRIGSVVLALHDASDVFLEVGKMSKYSGAEGLASCSFILFVLVWILLRLIYYPFWILRSTRLDNI